MTNPIIEMQTSKGLIVIELDQQNAPNTVQNFLVYVDEGYLFNTDATESMMVEARKYNVSFNISHQYLKQFKNQRSDSLLTAGTTIAFALFSKMKREHAARFSFLLSIPAILGAALIDFMDIKTIDTSTLVNYSAGAIAAFISGFIVIALLIDLIQRKKLKYFAYYCWTISLSSIIYFIIV
jgi:hypothetical protein